MIPEQFVVDFTERMKPLINETDPSFFEITVAMAFDHFSREQVDIAIIETGLGGRLDSTNVITPELSVITNIGMDHMNLLGDTLEKIAAEKAGIIKKNIPVVIGEILPETLPVFETKAKQMNASLTIASQQWQATDWRWEKQEMIVEVGNKHKTDHTVYHLDLPGIYQRKNLLTVLETCHQLNNNGWKLDHEAIQKALRSVKKLTGLHGRWDIIHHSPAVVLDVGHNEDGIRQLLEQVELTDHHELHMVTGFVKDKEVDKILSLLPETARYYFTQAHIPRAMDAESLKLKAERYHLKGKVYKDVNSALASAKSKAAEDDLIIVCGSVFLVGEVQF